MRRIHPFVWGHVLGAFLTGVVAGAFLDWKALAILSSTLAVNAAVDSLFCWWRPGFDAAAWKLWLTASFVNPLMLVALAFSIDHYECLVGERKGWDCLFAGIGPLTMALCLPSPLIGLAVRRWRKG